jgi:hypothetical protein
MTNKPLAADIAFRDKRTKNRTSLANPTRRQEKNAETATFFLRAQEPGIIETVTTTLNLSAPTPYGAGV